MVRLRSLLVLAAAAFAIACDNSVTEPDVSPNITITAADHPFVEGAWTAEPASGFFSGVDLVVAENANGRLDGHWSGTIRGCTGDVSQCVVVGFFITPDALRTGAAVHLPGTVPKAPIGTMIDATLAADGSMPGTMSINVNTTQQSGIAVTFRRPR